VPAELAAEATRRVADLLFGDVWGSHRPAPYGSGSLAPFRGLALRGEPVGRPRLACDHRQHLRAPVTAGRQGQYGSREALLGPPSSCKWKSAGSAGGDTTPLAGDGQERVGGRRYGNKALPEVGPSPARRPSLPLSLMASAGSTWPESTSQKAYEQRA